MSTACCSRSQSRGLTLVLVILLIPHAFRALRGAAHLIPALGGKEFTAGFVAAEPYLSPTEQILSNHVVDQWSYPKDQIPTRMLSHPGEIPCEQGREGIENGCDH